MSRYCLFIQEIILNQSILNFIYFVQNVLETLLFSLNNLGIVGHVGRPLPDLPLQGVHFSIQLEQQLLQSRHLLRGHLQVVGSRGVLQFRHQQLLSCKSHLERNGRNEIRETVKVDIISS